MRWLIILLMVCWSNVVWAKQRVAILEFRGVGIDQNVLMQMWMKTWWSREGFRFKSLISPLVKT